MKPGMKFKMHTTMTINLLLVHKNFASKLCRTEFKKRILPFIQFTLAMKEREREN